MKKLFSKQVKLRPENIIASGRQRTCYQHPEHDDLCIKVHHADRDEKETLREVRYYQRMYKNHFIATTVSKYYGTQTTNLGTGYIFQLIKDKTGNVSHTLDFYLKNDKSFLKHKKNIRLAYQNFKASVFKEAITTMALKSYNIVYQLGYKPSGQFFIIDNLGSSNLIPLDYYSTTIARATLARRFSDFEKRIYREYHIKL
ncbi:MULTISPECIES: YrbL family protein [Providencia]|uniref:PhoP regulatory network protein YrbL n=4 Tax=Providencia heimbachae TaxID=333962 RepID=A0A1B7JHW6_9GAMM|nr:YrbL family protein [Providencia heimbachae]MBP6122708.1 hypothetical protein [Providencia sp.]MDD9341702.1 YrbL family protein [Providencia heimbachae]NIH22418.1 hypothetical protein [Providencia heimbachae]OAT47523.1 hypothetical protein M998_3708 [Providencia heimbachae ATCC 35613]QCJ69801.1 hypothetical protein C9446_08005 [Providencia heimbachae]